MSVGITLHQIKETKIEKGILDVNGRVTYTLTISVKDSDGASQEVILFSENNFNDVEIEEETIWKM